MHCCWIAGVHADGHTASDLQRFRQVELTAGCNEWMNLGRALPLDQTAESIEGLGTGEQLLPERLGGNSVLEAGCQQQIPQSRPDADLAQVSQIVWVHLISDAHDVIPLRQEECAFGVL